MGEKQRKYATAKHPTIEALVHGLYRYADRAHALDRFQSIKNHFILSKKQPESSPDDPVLHFWIKGYALTPEEEAQGFTGHYCEMRLGQTETGFHTLTATRLERPISVHPQKKRLHAKHPNWGHPVMRAVKKAKVYASLEIAAAELERLHTQFPEVSIPGVNKLYIIVYEKRAGISRPTHKVALEITPHASGGFTITCRDNEKPARPASKQPPGATAPAPTAAPKPQQGIFTAREALRQKKRAAKRKRSDPRIGTTPDTSDPA